LLKIGKYEAILTLLFLATLPLVNPWVRGDGVGYYAFARAPLIEHGLDFTKDWLYANSSFRSGRIDASGQLNSEQYTATGHVDNHFAVGPAILWAPFLVTAHAAVLILDGFGGQVPADGFSEPYRLAMALGTALYGFLAILISFRLARRYAPERWAFLASLGIWFGTSLPVYIYFNPSWAHAPSAFVVSVFIWYWLRTRGNRSLWQWTVLGVIGGLMLNVYYLNGIFLILPLLESLGRHWAAFRSGDAQPTYAAMLKYSVFVVALLGAFMPTLLTRKIVYGNYFKTGYEDLWVWNSPYLFKVLFSADHGLFSWTPIVVLAVVGLFLGKFDRTLQRYSIIVFALFLYVVGCYKDWDGISSFGNRFFVSLTPLFILGLAALLDAFGRHGQETKLVLIGWGGTALLILWNLGLIFQWGMHLIPERGPVSWRVAAFNQFAVVPEQASQAISSYFWRRRELMNHIELKDLNQINNKSRESQGAGSNP
jgi:hypothetical protein